MSESIILAANEWPATTTIEPPIPLPHVRVDDFDSGSPEKLSQWELERSPRLNADPNAKLNTYEEVSWYRSKLEQIGKSSSYLKAIDEVIDDNPILRDISPNTRALVCMPVAATSEYDSVFGALSLYAQQDSEILQATTILAHANWTENAARNPEKSRLIAQTLSEIERAKQVFPQLRIASFTSQFEDDFIKERGGIVGEAVRRLFDVGLMTVERMKQNGQPPEHDVLIIRNDSDGRGMDRHHLKRMVNAADTNPRVDGFTGVVRWDTKTHVDYPGFGIITNFREIMHTATALGNVDVPVMTVGINSAIRASTLAAIGCLGRGKYIGVGSDDREMGMRVIDARRSSRSSHMGSLAVGAVLRAPITYVTGAGIDTSAERLLTTYRKGVPITRAWDSFDSGGHTDRRWGANSVGLIQSENLSTIEEIATRVEDNINGMINVWFRSPAHIKMGLALTFPKYDGASNEPLYDLSLDPQQYTFNFTPAGRMWLAGTLSCDGAGDFRAYGDKIRRKLYEESANNPQTSRFVEALS